VFVSIVNYLRRHPALCNGLQACLPATILAALGCANLLFMEYNNYHEMIVGGLYFIGFMAVAAALVRLYLDNNHNKLDAVVWSFYATTWAAASATIFSNYVWSQIFGNDTTLLLKLTLPASAIAIVVVPFWVWTGKNMEGLCDPRRGRQPGEPGHICGTISSRSHDRVLKNG
jgi:hypothetical protein